MTLRCATALIACLSSLGCGLAIALGVVALSPGVAQAADCMDRFPQGRFGILPSHPAVAKADPEAPGKESRPGVTCGHRSAGAPGSAEATHGRTGEGRSK